CAGPSVGLPADTCFTMTSGRMRQLMHGTESAELARFCRLVVILRNIALAAGGLPRSSVRADAQHVNWGRDTDTAKLWPKRSQRYYNGHNEQLPIILPTGADSYSTRT